MASAPETASPDKPNSSHKCWWSSETVAVVTGANRGIGFAFAKRLAELGVTVVLTARDAEKGRAAADALRGARSGRVEFRRLDLTDDASIVEFADWLRRTFRVLDILVNNAGVSFNSIDTNSVEHAETVIRTNFLGTKALTTALLPLFRRSLETKSRILNISSRLGTSGRLRNPTLKAAFEDAECQLTDGGVCRLVDRFLGHAKAGTWREEGWPDGWTDYSVSKLALNTYSRLLARRVEGSGLCVNCYCPGYTRTDMTGGTGTHTADEAAGVGVRVLLLPPEKLPTGMLFKWNERPYVISKL